MTSTRRLTLACAVAAATLPLLTLGHSAGEGEAAGGCHESSEKG